MKSKLFFFIIASNLFWMDAWAQGKSCSTAIVVCDTNSFTLDTILAGSSPQMPSCFAGSPMRDLWYKFTVNQTGVLAWKAKPVVPSTEFDWALWDITTNCPGTVVCCNYHYANGSGNGFGMQTVDSSGTCFQQSGFGNPNLEFSPTVVVISGHIYAIQIDNWSGTANGFTFQWTGSTCNISCASSIEKPFTSSKNINIYPNPFSNTSTIEINSDLINQNENLTFVLFDIFGQKLMQKKITGPKTEIQKGNFQSGIYFYKLNSNNKIIASGKLIIN